MISQKEQRALILSKLLLAYFGAPLDRVRAYRRNAEAVADVLLLSAIYVGQCEDQPMTAHKLAQYSGIPRPTVARKLKELQAVGLLDVENGLACIPQRVIDRPEFLGVVRELSKLVKKAAAMLSKMDT